MAHIKVDDEFDTINKYEKYEELINIDEDEIPVRKKKRYKNQAKIKKVKKVRDI